MLLTFVGCTVKYASALYYKANLYERLVMYLYRCLGIKTNKKHFRASRKIIFTFKKSQNKYST